MITLSETTVVFDLDDTIYSERDYQLSGYKFIIESCNLLYDVDITETVYAAVNRNDDVLEEIVKHLKLSNNSKDSLLWLYRLHCPKISLSESTKLTLDIIKNNAKHVAIVTDGRELSQRQKLYSLGLSDWPVFISESWDEIKPGEKRFKHIMKTMPASNFVYIGDNIKKDFITPNKLGWTSIGLKDSGHNIHSQNVAVMNSYLPHFWINTLNEVTKLIRVNNVDKK